MRSHLHRDFIDIDTSKFRGSAGDPTTKVEKRPVMAVCLEIKVDLHLFPLDDWIRIGTEADNVARAKQRTKGILRVHLIIIIASHVFIAVGHHI